MLLTLFDIDLRGDTICIGPSFMDFVILYSIVSVRYTVIVIDGINKSFLYHVSVKQGD